MEFKNIAIICALNNKIAKERKDFIVKKYGFIDVENKKIPDKTDLIIALGGDGLMLHSLHKYAKNNAAIYGINCGNIGFLTNEFEEKDLMEKIYNAKKTEINPLKMTAYTENKKYNEIAINEVSLLRQSHQVAKINVKINGKERIESLASDGILVATPAGSTAYNMSLRGVIIPFGTKILALTPISPFRPRNWPGAIIPSDAKIEFEILDYKTRPVSATADYVEVRNVKKVVVFEDKKTTFTILFDKNHSLEERIIKQQFIN
jgi:NAD+ kinase